MMAPASGGGEPQRAHRHTQKRESYKAIQEQERGYDSMDIAALAKIQHSFFVYDGLFTRGGGQEKKKNGQRHVEKEEELRLNQGRAVHRGPSSQIMRTKKRTLYTRAQAR
jgi:hypothetical protein